MVEEGELDDEGLALGHGSPGHDIGYSGGAGLQQEDRAQAEVERTQNKGGSGHGEVAEEV